VGAEGSRKGQGEVGDRGSHVCEAPPLARGRYIMGSGVREGGVGRSSSSEVASRVEW